MKGYFPPIAILIITLTPLAAQVPEFDLNELRMQLASAMNQSYLGVGAADIDNSRAHDLKLKEVYGVEITRVEENSAAAKAGLKAGDVVLQYNGQRVESFEQFKRFVRETPAGREVHLLVSRDGAQVAVPVVMGSQKMPPVISAGPTWLDLPSMTVPDSPRMFQTFRGGMLGVETEALTPQLASFFGVKEGVLVRAVANDSPAQKAGIKAGDVITKVDQSAVATPMDVIGAIHSVGQKRTFPVELMRDKHSFTINVTIDPDQSTMPLHPFTRSVKM